VANASPIVEVEAKIPGQKETLRILGIDVFRAVAVHPNVIGNVAKSSANDNSDAPPALLDSDAIFLSPAAMRWLHVEVGQNLAVQSGLQTIQLHVAGTLPNAGAGLKIASMDIAAAQWRLHRLGLLSRIDLKLRQGININEFRHRLSALLPAGIVADTPEHTQIRIANLSRAYRVNLNALALVALFTGGFLVFSNQALSAVRRRAEIALLRVIGMTRFDIVRLLLTESLIVGVPGSVLGLIVGYVIADLASTQIGGDLGGGYFSGVVPQLHLDPIAALAFFALGLIATLAGSFAPALEAAHARPAAALKAGDEETALRKVRAPWPGLIIIGIGALLTTMGPIDGLPLPGYGAISLLLIGGIALVPYLAQFFLSHMPTPSQPILQLAIAQLAGAPGRASIALAGIVASFSLMVAMAIMIASFRDSVDQWLTKLLPADIYMRAAGSGDSGFLPADDIARIVNTPGVSRAEFLRVDQLPLDPDKPPVTLLSRAIDAANPSARLPLIGITAPIQSNGPPPIWISEAMVDLYGFHVGKIVQLPIGGREVSCVVAGVWRDYARQHGSIVIRNTDYQKLTGDSMTNDAALWVMPSVSTSQLIAALRANLSGGEQLEFAEPGEIRAVTLRIFDHSFAITYVLEAVAILIGLAGVAASFSAQALTRAREFGTLRHIGMTRLQIAAMLAAEGGLLAILGIAVGFALGSIISLILIQVINPQSFHWTMDLHMPWYLLASLASALFFAAVVTAIISCRRAMSKAAIAAVREDW